MYKTALAIGKKVIALHQVKLNPGGRKFNRMLQNKTTQFALSPKDEQGNGGGEASMWSLHLCAQEEEWKVVPPVSAAVVPHVGVTRTD